MVETIEASLKEESAKFLLERIDNSIIEIKTIFRRDVTKADSNQLLIWRKETSSVNTTYEKIQDNYKQCLEIPITSEQLRQSMAATKSQFSTLDQLKQTYSENLVKEINNRELDKLSDFNKASLNIKLDKFSGYDGQIDFYTFKLNFDKMHSLKTPSHLLPDLLKNNYLTGQALTMVKSIESMDEIWQRLKEAFGNPRLMLSKKLQEIDTIESHKKDPKKLSSTFSKIVNSMKELSALAEKHHI